MQDFFKRTDYFSVNRVFIYPRTLRKAGVCPFGDGFRHKKSTCCRKCLKRTFIVRRRLFSAVLPFFALPGCRVYGFSAKVTTEISQNREEFRLLFPIPNGKTTDLYDNQRYRQASAKERCRERLLPFPISKQTDCSQITSPPIYFESFRKVF